MGGNTVKLKARRVRRLLANRQHRGHKSRR